MAFSPNEKEMYLNMAIARLKQEYPGNDAAIDGYATRNKATLLGGVDPDLLGLLVNDMMIDEYMVKFQQFFLHMDDPGLGAEPLTQDGIADFINQQVLGRERRVPTDKIRQYVDLAVVEERLAPVLAEGQPRQLNQAERAQIKGFATYIVHLFAMMNEIKAGLQLQAPAPEAPQAGM